MVRTPEGTEGGKPTGTHTDPNPPYKPKSTLRQPKAGSVAAPRSLPPREAPRAGPAPHHQQQGHQPTPNTSASPLMSSGCWVPSLAAPSRPAEDPASTWTSGCSYPAPGLSSGPRAKEVAQLRAGQQQATSSGCRGRPSWAWEKKKKHEDLENKAAELRGGAGRWV